MRRVILESPYAGKVKENVAYARAALRDCLLRGEAPLASHLLYTQDGVLDDLTPAERVHGMEAGLEWLRFAEATVVYTDQGISAGMAYGVQRAEELGIPVEFRQLSPYIPDPAQPHMFPPMSRKKIVALRRKYK